MPCDALVVVSELLRAGADATTSQIEASMDYFNAEPDRQEIEGHRGITAFLMQQAPWIGRNRMLDVGAGRGTLAAGACEHFDEVYATDLNMETLKRCAEHWNCGLKLVEQIGDAPDGLDAVTLWHVVEHLVDAPSVFDVLVAKLAPGGAVFWQVPAFRREFVCPTHYAFHTEHSARVLMERAGLECVNVWPDNDFGFLTILARKPTEQASAV